MRDAAAGGSRSMGGGARSRRRTDLAMWPLGATVVNVGVDERWPSALLGEPLPWAEAVGAADAGGQRAVDGDDVIIEATKATSAAAGNSRSLDEETRPCRRTDLAMRPLGAAVVWCGVDGLWSSAQF